MSLGLDFLKSVVASGDKKAFRMVRSEMLTENEREAHAKIAAHLKQHHDLPSLDFCTREGIRFGIRSKAETTAPEVWVRKLRERQTYNAINEIHPSLVAAMKEKNMEAVVEFIKDMNSASKTLNGRTNYASLNNEARQVIQRMQAAKSQVGLLGISSGWESLDAMTDGIQAGDIWVVAGRPSIGKSYQLLHMARTAHDLGEDPLVMSMEMSRAQIATRWMAMKTGINPSVIRKGIMSTWAEQRLIREAEGFGTRNPAHLLSGDFNASLEGIEEAVDEHRPSVMYIDSIYLMSPSDRQRGYVSKWESISAVFAGLKQILVRYNIGAVVTVQFNRNVRQNSTKEMDLGDVAGGDSISQDASILIGSRKWVSPFSDIRRRNFLLKNREGITGDWGINFGFSPMDFSECFESENEAEDDDGGEATPAFDTNWML